MFWQFETIFANFNRWFDQCFPWHIRTIFSLQFPIAFDFTRYTNRKWTMKEGKNVRKSIHKHCNSANLDSYIRHLLTHLPRQILFRCLKHIRGGVQRSRLFCIQCDGFFRVMKPNIHNETTANAHTLSRCNAITEHRSNCRIDYISTRIQDFTVNRIKSITILLLVVLFMGGTHFQNQTNKQTCQFDCIHVNLYNGESRNRWNAL